MEDRYNHLNKYLKNKFGERVLKICVDGGFTCPNRDGSKGYGGCIFCGERGSGENLSKCDNLESIPKQINKFLDSYRGERANKFIVYFQNFSNTYDSVERLKEKYSIALSTSSKIIGLEIATRPDCITEEIASLLSEYSKKYYVCVELGLQTANDSIGEVLNRGYDTKDFVTACEILSRYEISIVAHLMVGLPNETREDILDTVSLINNCGCSGIKIHSTYVIEGTELNNMYTNGDYAPISQEYYVDCVADIIKHLNKDIIIHRINADPPKTLFVAPEWALHKKVVLNAINKRLELEKIHQGKL